MEDADGVGRGVVGAERIGADELGETRGAVRRGRPVRAHLVQDDRDAGLRRLPGGFRAGQPAADDVNGTHRRACHKAGPQRQPGGLSVKKTSGPGGSRCLLFRARRSSGA